MTSEGQVFAIRLLIWISVAVMLGLARTELSIDFVADGWGSVGMISCTIQILDITAIVEPLDVKFTVSFVMDHFLRLEAFAPPKLEQNLLKRVQSSYQNQEVHGTKVVLMQMPYLRVLHIDDEGIPLLKLVSM